LRFPICCFLFSALVAGEAAAGQTPAPKKPAAAAKRSASSKVSVASDLAQRVAKFKPVRMPFDATGLTPREKQMVEKLVHAAGLLDCVYWRQSDPEGLELYLSLEKSKDPQDQLLRRYLKINGGRFDLIDDNKPFVGTEPAPPGRNFYQEFYTTSQGWVTQSDIGNYLSKNPSEKAGFYNPYTVIRGEAKATDDLFTVSSIPYHVAFADFLKPMAKDLRDAARLSDDPAFAKFLQLRADALLTDDYFESDLAWLDLENPKFDIVFAPYETYLDGLLGVKTSYGAAVMIRNEEESRRLAVFQQHVPDLQDWLPLAPEDRPSKRGKQSPMEVMDAIYRSGDLLHGYQAVADNLPNDPRIHEQKGSKKIFWKNFMDARVNYVILPLAGRVMRPDQVPLVTGEGVLDWVILHEISHGLGPAFARTLQGKTDIREAIGPSYSALEEAKADVVGVLCVQWLVEHGVIPREKQNMLYASYMGETFRTVRFGVGEAHGKGRIMEFNYLAEQGAVRRDAATGYYEVDFTKMPAAIALLAKELLEQEATGDRARVERWFSKYGQMPVELTAALAKSSDIPVDVDPDFDFHPALR